MDQPINWPNRLRRARIWMSALPLIANEDRTWWDVSNVPGAEVAPLGRCCLKATLDVERLRRYQPCFADQVVKEVVDEEYVIDTNANLDERLRRRRNIDQENFLLTRRILRLGRWTRGKQPTILCSRQHADLTLLHTVQLGCRDKNGIGSGRRHTSFRGIG
jgi:hypothetical protein